MSKVRLHVWIEEDVLDNLVREAKDMNVVKSEMLRIILNRHYRTFSTVKDRYSRALKYDDTDKHTMNANTILPMWLYNSINKYCNDNGVTRSCFIRRACIELLKKEGYFKKEW